jgi:hypothetical protein
MSGTGALAGQLPLRLGVVGNSGLDANDHARVCADLLAVVRTIPTFRARFSRSGTVVTLVAYRGLFAAPVITTAALQFTIPLVRTIYDGTEVIATPHLWEVFRSGVQSQTSGLRIYTTTTTVVVSALADGCEVTVVGYGADFHVRTIADYGGAADKRNCATEAIPYAWTAYRMLQDARGSAYSKELSGLVHVENQALARAHAARWRDAERLAANANPATAYEKAEEWRQTLGVRPRDGDTPERLRTRCAARLLAARGATRQSIDDAVSALLGSVYVKTWRYYGTDLATPPTNTYWPTINPGNSGNDLGGGAWYSDRSHMVVEVTQPSDVGLAEFLDKVDQAYELLDLRLPAWVTFDWALNVEDGFTLDIDLLDFAAVSDV